MIGGNISIVDSTFEKNNPSFESYPSLRRNIICSQQGILNLARIKGENGFDNNSSLWVLSEGCTVVGEEKEKEDSYFIPTLSSFSQISSVNGINYTLTDSLLIPCHLSFSLLLISLTGEERVKEMETSSFLNETTYTGNFTTPPLDVMYDSFEIYTRLIYFGNDGKERESNRVLIKNRGEGFNTGTFLHNSTVVVIVVGSVGGATILIPGCVLCYGVCTKQYNLRKPRSLKVWEKQFEWGDFDNPLQTKLQSSSSSSSFHSSSSSISSSPTFFPS
jgi:hypothetical protein